MVMEKETDDIANIPDVPEIIEPPGIELLKNADFSDGLKNWRQYAKCNPEIITDENSGKNVVSISEMSENWAVVCQDLTRAINEYGKGTYYFGANVKTGGGAIKIMVVVHYRDDTGRNWTTSDYVEITDKDYTYIDKTAIIDWSGEKASEVDIYLSTEKPFEGSLIIDSMTFRHISDMIVPDGLQYPDVALRNERALVGVIRWDAWIGNVEGGVGLVVNRSLSPEKYHFRLPWFSKIIGPNEVFIDGATQEIVDDEIQFAKTYGIDYFAILHYSDGMSFARTAYINSLYKNGIKWCVVFGTSGFTDYSVLDYYVGQFGEPCYQKTTDGRPVVYIFQVESWIKDGVDYLRDECKKAGIAEPYIIGMNFDIPKAAMIAAELKLQAVSLYTGGIPESSCPYSAVMESDAAKWQSMKKTGAQFVPHITTGWDKRPRYDNPNPWEPDYEDFKNQYCEQGTPEEIAQNIENALDFCEDNKEQTVFNSVIVYAWNENDEGGWICPTYFELRDSGKPLRLEAIREMLKKRRAAYADIDMLDPETKEAILNLAVAGVFGDGTSEKFEPEREISAVEFSEWIVRSVGYLADFDTKIGGDEPMTRASAALLVYQLTQEIFDLPVSPGIE